MGTGILDLDFFRGRGAVNVQDDPKRRIESSAAAHGPQQRLAAIHFVGDQRQQDRAG